MIYFLFNNDDLVYVGKTRDITQRLREHTKDKQFNSYACLITDDDSVQETLYINLYKPMFNKRTLSIRNLMKCRGKLND